MKAITAILSPGQGLGSGQGALDRALRDPRVRQVARSLNMDLSDERTLRDLMQRTRKAVESSTAVTLRGPIAPSSGSELPVDSYARNAVRVYQQIAGFK